MLYTLYWDGADGIERVIVTFVLKVLSESDLPLLQAFETNFLKVGVYRCVDAPRRAVVLLTRACIHSFL